MQNEYEKYSLKWVIYRGGNTSKYDYSYVYIILTDLDIPATKVTTSYYNYNVCSEWKFPLHQVRVSVWLAPDSLPWYITSNIFDVLNKLLHGKVVNVSWLSTTPSWGEVTCGLTCNCFVNKYLKGEKPAEAILCSIVQDIRRLPLRNSLISSICSFLVGLSSWKSRHHNDKVLRVTDDMTSSILTTRTGAVWC